MIFLLFCSTSDFFFFRGRICGNVNGQKRSNKKKRGRSGSRNRPASQRRPATGGCSGVSGGGWGDIKPGPAGPGPAAAGRRGTRRRDPTPRGGFFSFFAFANGEIAIRWGGWEKKVPGNPPSSGDERPRSSRPGRRREPRNLHTLLRLLCLRESSPPPSARETVGNRPALRRIFDDSLIILLLCSANASHRKQFQMPGNYNSRWQARVRTPLGGET